LAANATLQQLEPGPVVVTIEFQSPSTTTYDPSNVESAQEAIDWAGAPDVTSC
jgi:hypothetical protein